MSTAEFGLGAMQFALEVEKEDEKLIGSPYRWTLMLLGKEGDPTSEDKLVKTGKSATETEAWDDADTWITVGLVDMLDRAAARSAARLGHGDQSTIILPKWEQKLIPKSKLIDLSLVGHDIDLTEA